jgi:hypothetical protein
MKCGCWIVADGNNRVGLILKKNPEATIAEIPERLLATARFGEWDAEMMDCVESMCEILQGGCRRTPLTTRSPGHGPRLGPHADLARTRRVGRIGLPGDWQAALHDCYYLGAVWSPISLAPDEFVIDPAP